MTDVFVTPISGRLCRWALAPVAMAALAGCSQFQPYQRPALEVPTQWQGAEAPVTGDATVQPMPWQDFIKQPALRSLVELALQRNQDARIAAAQLEQLRAQFRIREAARLPTVNAGVTGSRQTTGENQPINSTYTAGLQIAAWEIDLFGRLESLSEAARAQFLASEETLKYVRLGLVTSVSAAWLDVQSSQELLDLAERTLSTREDTLRLVQLRFEHGAASALEVRQAESLAASARVARAQQQQQRAVARNALTLLAGGPVPDALWPTAARPAIGGVTPTLADVAVGVPSRVLLDRPDIRAAEQQLVAADAQIGAARAALFPRISLTASLGSASSELSGLLGSGTWGWALAPQALLPLLDGGANRANLGAARAAREAALVQYEKAIQTAFREVNDALSGQTALRLQAQAQQDLLTAERERLRLTQRRLEQGVSSQLEWLDVQRSLYSAEQAAVQVQYAQQLNRVALYKALGGF